MVKTCSSDALLRPSAPSICKFFTSRSGILSVCTTIVIVVSVVLVVWYGRMDNRNEDSPMRMYPILSCEDTYSFYILIHPYCSWFELQ